MKRRVRRGLRRGRLTLLVLLLGGCAAPPAREPGSAPARGEFAARTLADDGLKQFLAANLGGVPARWDFEALAWVAFYYHPALELARAQWSTTQAAQRTAAARANPTLTVAPGFDGTHQAGVSPWFPSVNLDFLFPPSSRRRDQQEVARAEAEAARLSILAAAWAVRAELRSALADVAAAARRETAVQAQVAVQRALLALQQRRETAGLASAGEVGPLRLAVLRLDAAAVEASAQQAAGRARVAAALGVPGAALAGLALPAPVATAHMSAAALAAAQRESLRSRSDVLVALAKVRSAESAIAGETARRYPDFHLGPGYQYDQGQNKWSIALSLELPLFNRNEGPIAEALGRRAEAAAHLIAVQAQAIAAIESAAARQAALATQLEHAGRVRAEAAQLDALAQQRFDRGGADQVERQAARLELVLAEEAVAEAAAAAAQASGQLEDALQVPFPNLATLGETARLNDLKVP